jgi:pantoate--beta-alanine ligase
MKILHDITTLRAWRAQQTGVVFVPTMGNLHAGHLSLMQQAKQTQLAVLASIFVNPLQFGAGEDFSRYPRTLDADLTQLEQAGIDAVFVPEAHDIYPEPQTCFIELPELAQQLCGEFRPGHFRGMATVVMKLLQLAQPTHAIFGKKDYQQLAIIRLMCRQFCLPITIMAGETMRNDDGLALSSRNQYLAPHERNKAPQLYAELNRIKNQLQSGNNHYTLLEQTALNNLAQSGWQTEYISIRDAVLTRPEPDSKHLVILAAARIGHTRLIDNVEASLTAEPHIQ